MDLKGVKRESIIFSGVKRIKIELIKKEVDHKDNLFFLG